MEITMRQTRVFEDVPPASAEVRGDTNKSGKNQRDEACYWGVLCKRCRELVAFDVCPYVSFGPQAASMKPGAICCSLGHNHIYFPRDFGFLSSAVPISEAVMRANRDSYLAVNSPGKRSSHDLVPEVEPEASPEAEVPVPAPVSRSAKYAPDSRREAAGKAAKERWADWADSKKCCTG